MPRKGGALRIPNESRPRILSSVPWQCSNTPARNVPDSTFTSLRGHRLDHDSVKFSLSTLQKLSNKIKYVQSNPFITDITIPSPPISQYVCAYVYSGDRPHRESVGVRHFPGKKKRKWETFCRTTSGNSRPMRFAGAEWYLVHERSQ